jgi:hypothetical protein
MYPNPYEVAEEIQASIDHHEYFGTKLPDDWCYAQMFRERWIAVGQPATGSETDGMVWTYVLARWQLDEGTAGIFLYAARQYCGDDRRSLSDRQLDLMASLAEGWTGTIEDLIETTLRLAVEFDLD